MNIKILYDNQAKEGFQCGWGFSALVDDTTLFDAGEDVASLLTNMQVFGVDPEHIRQVVISHEDRDHTGGMAILKKCKNVTVYVPAGSSRSLKEEIMSLNPGAFVFEAVHDTTIDSHEFVTATLGSPKKEISLAVRTNKGLALVTGCAHPGLDKIIENASQFGNVHAVVGGFHGFSRLKALANVSVIIPSHCTQNRQEIADMYRERTQLVSAGTEISL